MKNKETPFYAVQPEHTNKIIVCITPITKYKHIHTDRVGHKVTHQRKNFVSCIHVYALILFVFLPMLERKGCATIVKSTFHHSSGTRKANVKSDVHRTHFFSATYKYIT